MDKIIEDYLKGKGYKSKIDENQESRVARWLEIYENKAKEYNTKIYNGSKYVDYKLKTLALPVRTCEDISDFFFNEKLDITISNEKINDAVHDCLKQNNFLHNSNKLMQLVCALGTGAFVPYLDNNVLKINYIDATGIVILKSTSAGVQDVLFWNKNSTDNGTEYIINAHILEKDGYIIENVKIIETKDKKTVYEDLGDMARIETKSFVPRFGIITNYSVNNFDINSPYGISRYANAFPEAFTTDVCFDSLSNEIGLGKKRVYVKQGAMNIKVGENGETIPIFDPNDVLFYVLPRRR